MHKGAYVQAALTMETSRPGEFPLGNSRKNQGFSPIRNVRFRFYNPLRHRRLPRNSPPALALMGEGGRETIIW